MAGATEQLANTIEISSGVLAASINLNGGFVESLQLDGDDLLFPRQVMDEDSQPKTRGGLHICSPYFGPGKALGLEAQHGFARDEPWQHDDEASRPNRLVMTLLSDGERFGQFNGLWQRLTIEVDDGFNFSPSLSCKLEVRNPTAERMVMSPGLHPYFPVSETASPNLRFLTTQYERDMTVHSVKRADLVEAQLIEGHIREASFVSRGRQVTITSHDLDRIIFWSGSPDKYVCAEPTSAAFLGSQAVIPMLASGGSNIYQSTITWKPGLEMRE